MKSLKVNYCNLGVNSPLVQFQQDSTKKHSLSRIVNVSFASQTFHVF